MQVTYGKETIPRTRLGTCLDTLIAFSQKIPATPFNRDDFVRALELSPNSTGPDQKLGSLLRFGLVERDVSQTKFVITDIGRTIVNNEGEKRSLAIENVIKRITPWNAIYQACNKTIPDNDTFVTLFKNTTGGFEEEIRRNLGQLKNAYREDIGCINGSYPFSIWSVRVSTRQSKKPSEPKSQQTTIANSPSLLGNKRKESSGKHKLVFVYGGTEIPIIDASSIALARLVIDEKEKELQLSKK
jgi:hypothetical protein